MPDKRQCDNCRFADRDYRPDGSVQQTWCLRYPTAVTVRPGHTCGEWRDATVTAEQEGRQVFLQQLVVALAASRGDLSVDIRYRLAVRELWAEAAAIADAQPED